MAHRGLLQEAQHDPTRPYFLSYTAADLCEIRRTEFDDLFPSQDIGNLVWLIVWRPRDDASIA